MVAASKACGREAGVIAFKEQYSALYRIFKFGVGYGHEIQNRQAAAVSQP
jgi:hypothetical protein